MYLLGFQSDIFSVGMMNAEAENSKRLQLVRAFYDNPQSPSVVRRQCLCLRLTWYASSLTAQKRKEPHNDKEPMLVRLGRGHVQAKTSALLVDIVSRLSDDSFLQITETLLALLLTEAHLVIRFDMYSRYPTALWRLCRKFNLQSYAAEILDFVCGGSIFRCGIFCCFKE